MDGTKLHYIQYDPEKIWNMIMQTHIEQGGDVLYPGDEKEIQLRTVLALMVQGFAAVDNALLMDSLSFTMRQYMDLYGEKRNCYRIRAQAAEAEVEITFAASMIKRTIPAGTMMTADGQRLYLTKDDIVQTGYSQRSTVKIIAEKPGTAGNGLTAGLEMQLCEPNDAIAQIIVTSPAVGGRDQESDENYRERIRKHGLVSITTGPRQQYEQVARSVSPDVLDAKAVRLAPCTVGVYLILADGADKEALKAAVLDALTPETERPLNDLVIVDESEEVPYTLNVDCTLEDGMTADDLTQVVAEYQAWQDGEIKLPFNPDRLMAKLYNAGVSRVQWAEGSNFNGGAVEYTPIGENQRCDGTITLNIITR